MKTDAETASAAPPTEKGANRREEILEAASALLLEEGYAGFSARGVAARAGLRLSHVQYYFASPAAILAELLERFVRRYGEEIMARFASGDGSGEERLYRALDFLLNDEAYRRDCGIFMIEVAGFASRNALIAAALARYYEIYFDLFSGIVKTLDPSLSPRVRARRARQCVALIEGMSMTRPHMGPKGEVDFSAREATRAIMRLVCGE
ncbi:TetR family transcriptional regulator [Parvibaculum sp.]|uniref:TetR/AcrR family transcriptional regulator n=1 Tax=Parvibaculum sp. TaxID=2024848 RepID=UPI001B19474F|nr:TetR family transcriptional regulator [Parvibaculum sp.]MBO6668189.1 TetR family transcriptional regulator [Parvibaculum sp.]MBO6691723.1 TetR family transcriptional regulator [Parvibaculum sp.]MBO6714693.1 TetR family transcriptional regulator [Parvibaculum sp.]